MKTRKKFFSQGIYMSSDNRLAKAFEESVNLLVSLNVPKDTWPKCFVFGSEANYDIPTKMSGTDLQAALGAINCFTLNIVTKHTKKNLGFPQGMWYMITCTTPAGSPKEHALEVHEKALYYFSYIKAKILIAALEKSNIYHIHYVVCLNEYPKNLARDLKNSCFGYGVNISKKVKNLKEFNGLCKYVLKREYTEKAETSVSLLICKTEYKEGQGYIIEPDF